MDEVKSWDNINRRFILVSNAACPALEVAIIEEDLGSRPSWTVKAPYHCIFVHLEGRLVSHQAKFENGPATTAIPSVGGVWMVPAGQRFDSLPRGNTTRFCEIRVPINGPDGELVEIAPQVDARDGLLHEAAKIFQLELGNDDLSRMSSRHLVEAIRWHIMDRYDLNRTHRAIDAKILSRSAKEHLMSYISDMIANRITLEDLASIAALDVHIFLKKFYASFGTTPAQYIIGIRIDRAKTLLTTSSLAVGDIASLTGFNSPSHFCVSFMKHVGISPMAFRQARR